MLNKEGLEIPDPKPMALPVGFRHPPSLTDTIRRLVKTELSSRAVALGRESFEEANDFDIPGEDMMPRTPYEVQVDNEEDLLADPASFNAALDASRAGLADPPPPPAPPPAAPKEKAADQGGNGGDKGSGGNPSAPVPPTNAASK